MTLKAERCPGHGIQTFECDIRFTLDTDTVSTFIDALKRCPDVTGTTGSIFETLDRDFMVHKVLPLIERIGNCPNNDFVEGPSGSLQSGEHAFEYSLKSPQIGPFHH